MDVTNTGGSTDKSSDLPLLPPSRLAGMHSPGGDTELGRNWQSLQRGWCQVGREEPAYVPTADASNPSFPLQAGLPTQHLTSPPPCPWWLEKQTIASISWTHQRGRGQRPVSRRAFQFCRNYTSVTKNLHHPSTGTMESRYLTRRKLASDFPFLVSLFKTIINYLITETVKYRFQWLYLKLIYKISLFDVGRFRDNNWAHSSHFTNKKTEARPLKRFAEGHPAA